MYISHPTGGHQVPEASALITYAVFGNQQQPTFIKRLMSQ